MAEGFARKYGGDVMRVSSAGLAPASFISPLTREVMSEKGISLDDHFPKALTMLDLRGVDAIVNMSGVKLVRDPGVPVQEWTVEDPIGQSIEKFRQVANQVEQGVIQIVTHLRNQPGQTHARASAEGAPAKPAAGQRPPSRFKFGRPRPQR
jgi:protein-tyrosine-phosphatase